MAEYIERERLKRAISADCQHLFSFDESLYDLFMINIDEIPAADVAPVVHGVPVRKNRPRKYECFEEVKTENGEILYKKHVYVDETNWAEYCPACGKRLCSRFKSYCPSCGAIMDLEG